VRTSITASGLIFLHRNCYCAMPCAMDSPTAGY
jgi:hypothetical protein